MSALQQDIYNQIKFRTKHLQHGWAYFTLDEVLRHDKVVPAWVYENPQLKKDRWTGLLDKEQKEIYEGDIVRCEGLVCRVDYVIEPAIAGFVFNQDGTGRYIEYAVRGGMAVHFEVIGNIYENPDLLPIQPKK